MVVQRSSLPVFLLFLALCLGAGFIGSYATASSVNTWYATLVKPSWTPPGWLFGPVWTILYILMAWSAYRIWKTGVSPASRIFLPFWIQLGLNFAWSWIFFYFHQPGWALGDLLLLLGVLLWNMAVFLSRDLPAGLMLVPYLLWGCFAGALNFVLWRMNL
jgi:tryptophan-rich sensory protein